MKLSDINNVSFLNNFYKTTCKYIFFDKKQTSPIALILYNHGNHYFVFLSSFDDMLVIKRLDDEMDLFLEFDMNLYVTGYRYNKEFEITKNDDEDIVFESNVFRIRSVPFKPGYDIIMSVDVLALTDSYSLPIMGRDLFGEKEKEWNKKFIMGMN